jgi:hypothetical protein
MEGDFGAALHLERNSEIMTAALLAFSASVLLGPYGKKTIMFGAAICKRNVSLIWRIKTSIYTSAWRRTFTCKRSGIYALQFGAPV